MVEFCHGEDTGSYQEHLKRERQGVKYLSILQCEICENIPHKKDLARSEYPEIFRGLEKIYTRYTEPDRYTEDSDMIMKCTLCGTCYHHYHSVDTEDAFVDRPSVIQNIQRFNLVRLKHVLGRIGKKRELNQLEKRYPELIEQFISIIKESPEKLNNNFRPYLIESVIDYYILENNWKDLLSLLLAHPDPEIAFGAFHDLALIYGEIFRGDGLPVFTSYRDFTSEIKERGIMMLNRHNSEYKKSLERFKGSGDKDIKRRYKDLMKSARYYRVIKGSSKKKENVTSPRA